MTLIKLAAALALLAGNFFFVAVEFTIASARRTTVDELVARGVRGAASMRHGIEHIDAYLSACQLGITVCSIGLGITAEPVVAHALGGVFPEFTFFGVGSAAISFILAYATVSIFHVVIGELAPKSLAIARNQATGLVLLPPMRAFYMATKPIVDALNWLGNIVLRPFGIPPASEAGHAPHSREELEALMSHSEQAGVLEPEQRSFAQGAFSFGDRRAREVMVPRGQVALLKTDDSIEEAVGVAVRTRHIRLPLCEGESGLDDTIGVVHVLALLEARQEAEAGDLRSLCTPILQVAEVTLLDELMEQMRSERCHMAVLKNEYGTAVGIVTLENVLEEIVGDIRDEYDPGASPVLEPLEGGAIRIRGDVPLRLVQQELDITLDERREATLGGYVTETLGRTPSAGETLVIDAWKVTVDDVRGAVVTSLTLRPAGAEDTGQGGGDEGGKE